MTDKWSKKGTAKLARSCRVFARGNGMTWQGCVKMHGVWWLSRARGLRMGYFYGIYMGSQERTTQKLSENLMYWHMELIPDAFRCCSPLTVTVRFEFSEGIRDQNPNIESFLAYVYVAIWWSWIVAYLDLTDSFFLAAGTLAAQARLHLVLEGGGAGWVDQTDGKGIQESCNCTPPFDD